jgi:hypothetical protein
MDRVERCGAIAALVLTLALAGCGGGGGSATTGSATTQSVQGVATPSSVSVVTAKNAQ